MKSFMYDDIWIQDAATGEIFNAYKPNFQQYYRLSDGQKVRVEDVENRIERGEWLLVNNY